MLRKQSLLSELISSLETINSRSYYAGLSENIEKVKEIAKNTKNPNNQNLVFSIIITVISRVPDLMTDPNNKQLEELCLKLDDPDLRLFLFPKDRNRFYGESPEPPTQKLTRNI